MEFIVIVIGLFILNRAGSLPSLQRDNWYRGWMIRLDGQRWLKVVPHGSLILSLLLPVLLVALLLMVLDDHWFGLPQFLLSLLLFLYSLGRGDLEEQVEGYRDDLKRDDLEAAYRDAADFNPAHEEGTSENWSQLHADRGHPSARRTRLCGGPVARRVAMVPDGRSAARARRREPGRPRPSPTPFPTR